MLDLVEFISLQDDLLLKLGLRSFNEIKASFWASTSILVSRFSDLAIMMSLVVIDLARSCGAFL